MVWALAQSAVWLMWNELKNPLKMQFKIAKTALVILGSYCRKNGWNRNERRCDCDMVSTKLATLTNEFNKIDGRSKQNTLKSFRRTQILLAGSKQTVNSRVGIWMIVQNDYCGVIARACMIDHASKAQV